MKKILKIAGSLLGFVGVPLGVMTQTTDPLLDTLLAFVAGFGAAGSTLIVIIETGGEFVGVMISYFGKKKWPGKWESEIEPRIQEGIKAISEGLDKDDK
jgi:hypothetical protein